MLSYFLTSLGMHHESLKMSLLDSRLQFLVSSKFLPWVFSGTRGSFDQTDTLCKAATVPGKNKKLKRGDSKNDHCLVTKNVSLDLRRISPFNRVVHENQAFVVVGFSNDVSISLHEGQYCEENVMIVNQDHLLSSYLFIHKTVIIFKRLKCFFIHSPASICKYLDIKSMHTRAHAHTYGSHTNFSPCWLLTRMTPCTCMSVTTVSLLVRYSC